MFGWIVNKLTKQHERRSSSTVAEADAVEGGVVKLLLWMDSSGGRAVGENFGSGARLVRTRAIALQFALRLEWYLQLELLTPARILERGAHVFNHALVFMAKSQIIRDAWQPVVDAANEHYVTYGPVPVATQAGVVTAPAINAEASVHVLESVIRATMLSKQKGLRHVHGLAPNRERQSAHREEMKHAGKHAGKQGRMNCAAGVQYLSQVVGLPAEQLQSTVLACAVQQAAMGAMSAAAAASGSAVQSGVAVRSFGESGRQLLAEASLPGVDLQTQYTWTIASAACDGVLFSEHDGGDGRVFCVVSSKPAAVQLSSQSRVDGSLNGVQVGDVVLRLLRVETAAAAGPGKKKTVQELVQMDPVDVLVHKKVCKFPITLVMTTKAALTMLAVHSASQAFLTTAADDDA